VLTTYDILKKYGIAPTEVRLVRHGNKEIPILETFRTNRKRFEAYQGFQSPKKFGDSKHIAVFAPLDGRAALFLGLWDVVACKINGQLTDADLARIDEYGFPQDWKSDAVCYDLKHNEAMSDLSERLVIDWGLGALAWVQRSDKPVLEIRRPNSIGDFASYSEVKLSYYDLKTLMNDASSNLTWRNALSSVNGVYLIRDKSSGKLYVGSAYGEQGIYARWKIYATSGHGGDVMLRDLDHSQFEFSVLEIAPPTLSAQEVIDIENKWKDRLGTRRFGNLNSMEGSRTQNSE
jgi:hypothetical protein